MELQDPFLLRLNTSWIQFLLSLHFWIKRAREAVSNVGFSWNTILFISVGSVLLLKLSMCQNQFSLSQYVKYSLCKQICAKYLLELKLLYIIFMQKDVSVKSYSQHKVVPKSKVLHVQALFEKTAINFIRGMWSHLLSLYLLLPAFCPWWQLSIAACQVDLNYILNITEDTNSH